MTTEEEALASAVMRDCGKCLKVNICALYRAIAPLLNSFESRKPFDLKDLAKICQEFTPVYAATPAVHRIM